MHSKYSYWQLKLRASSSVNPLLCRSPAAILHSPHGALTGKFGQGAAGKEVAARSRCVQQQWMGQHQIKPYHKAAPEQATWEKLCKAAHKSQPSAMLHTPVEQGRKHFIYCPIPKGASANWCSPTAFLLWRECVKRLLNFTWGIYRCPHVPSTHLTDTCSGSRGTRLAPAPPCLLRDRVSETEPRSLRVIKC